MRAGLSQANCPTTIKALQASKVALAQFKIDEFTELNPTSLNTSPSEVHSVQYKNGIYEYGTMSYMAPELCMHMQSLFLYIFLSFCLSWQCVHFVRRCSFFTTNQLPYILDGACRCVRRSVSSRDFKFFYYKIYQLKILSYEISYNILFFFLGPIFCLNSYSSYAFGITLWELFVDSNMYAEKSILASAQYQDLVRNSVNDDESHIEMLKRIRDIWQIPDHKRMVLGQVIFL